MRIRVKVRLLSNFLLDSIALKCYVPFKLLDVFGQKSNVSLVFDFMDTDLEVNTCQYLMTSPYHLFTIFYIFKYNSRSPTTLIDKIFSRRPL